MEITDDTDFFSSCPFVYFVVKLELLEKSGFYLLLFFFCYNNGGERERGRNSSFFYIYIWRIFTMKTQKGSQIMLVGLILFMACGVFSKTPPKTADQLLAANAEQWYTATHHQFLNEVKDGTLSQEAFSIWLAQDYYFAGTLLEAQSLMLLYSPRSDQNLLIGGLFALDSELSWFEQNAGIYNIDLTRPVLPTCQAYNDFLLAMQYKPYVVQITCMWALNRAYFDSWSTALPGAPKYKEFIDRFTSQEYKDYIDALEMSVNAALDAAAQEQREQAQLYFLWVARYEKDFWDMALSGE